jgi:hypothetical protein
LVQKAETIQVHFILEGEGLRDQRNYHGWKVYMESYVATMDIVSWFAEICVRHFQEVGMMQFKAYYVGSTTDTAFG